MADLDKALAAGRALVADAQETDGGCTSDWETMRDIIAALDAARGHAIGYVFPGDVERAKLDDLWFPIQPTERDEFRAPVYLAPPAALAVPGLHPRTADLVQRFAVALALKLAAAEAKYGYSDDWAKPDWMDECRAKLVEHVAKGDPRDVAAYCAFLWQHGERTAMPAPVAVPVAWRDFVESVAGQKPEKPDHWNACSQCERNADDAKELVAPLAAADKENTNE